MNMMMGGMYAISGESMMDAQELSQKLRPTHVVTCILLHTDRQETRMLLLRRSQKVGSYRGRWAGVSGFVEPNVLPDEQVSTEIWEETSLQRDQVRLLRRGTVVEYSDAELGRHFFIHPYLFKVLTPESIRIDWEATEMRWIDPCELPRFETVPKLQEVYQSALCGEVMGE